MPDVENRLIEVPQRADRWLARVPVSGNGSGKDERAALGWLVILAALTIGALVVALGQVSHQAVQQGESRRAATAADTTAFWICQNSHSRELLDSCVAQLNPPSLAPSVANATLQGKHLVDLGAPSGRH